MGPGSENGRASSGDLKDNLALERNIEECGGSNDDIYTPHSCAIQVIPVPELFKSSNKM
jgi:hypothetical protein